PPRRRLSGGYEEVGAVEVDRVDRIDGHEAGDVDRTRVARALDRLELRVLHDDELALRDLPAAHDLVLRHLAIVEGAPALLLDRRQALVVQHPEGHVRLPRSRLRRRREADGDVDESEADRSVP